MAAAPLCMALAVYAWWGSVAIGVRASDGVGQRWIPWQSVHVAEKISLCKVSVFRHRPFLFARVRHLLPRSRVPCYRWQNMLNS